MSTPITPCVRAAVNGMVFATGICQEAVTYQRPRAVS